MSERDEELISRLIHSSGRGPVASAEARERIYAAVHREWRRNIDDRVDRRVDDRPAGIARGRRRIGYKSAVLAFAVMAALAIGIGVLLRRPSPVGPPVKIAVVDKTVGRTDLIEQDGLRTRLGSATESSLFVGQGIVTASDAGVALALVGGPSLRVGSSSEIRFASPSLVRLVSGTVYLDSGMQAPASQPLGVETPYGTVHHVGTQYEVHIGDAQLRIRVREGVIAFVGDDGNDVRSDAGEELLVAQTGALARNAFSTTDPQWQWAEALATLPATDERSASDVLSWAARQTGRRLRYETQSVEDTAADLTLHNIGGLSPQEALDVIETTTALGYTLTDDSLIVLQ